MKRRQHHQARAAIAKTTDQHPQPDEIQEKDKFEIDYGNDLDTDSMEIPWVAPSKVTRLFDSIVSPSPSNSASASPAAVCTLVLLFLLPQLNYIYKVELMYVITIKF